MIKKVPAVIVVNNVEGMMKAAAMDGSFPLVTNTSASALEILKSYKYQPYIEKRHALLKSGLEVAPIFLKKNVRIEALMFVYFLAQLTAALIERAVRKRMLDSDITAIPILPEGRLSKSPSAQQILATFHGLSRSKLQQNSQHIQTFLDPLSSIQTQLLELLKIPKFLFT